MASFMDHRPDASIPPPAHPRRIGLAPKQNLDTGRSLALWDEATFAFLHRMGFRAEGKTLLLAVSGGSDSTVLLDFWSRHAMRLECALHALHIHHGLRSESDGDADFVQDLCRERDLPLSLIRLDPALRRPRESREMWARRERYRCFAEVSEATGAHWVCTGHQRDDMVETVFQRLARGTGIIGLAGIPFTREPRIARPLLNRSREDIRHYLELRGMPWREDESNADTRIGRNWFRHRYLPGLRLEEPGLDARIFSLAMDLQGMGVHTLEDKIQAAGLVRQVLPEGVSQEPDWVASDGDEAFLSRDAQGSWFLAAPGIESLVASGATVSLSYWLNRLAKNGASPCVVTAKILREFQRQWKSNALQVAVPLGPNLYLERRNPGIYLGKKTCPETSEKAILVDATGTHSWSWEGKRYTLALKRYARPPGLQFPAATGNRALFDAASFSCTLQIRTRKDGDRFSPYGVRSTTRKLKVFLNEKKVPKGMRDSIPLIFSGGTLAWVPGHGVSDSFKVGAATDSILEMELSCTNP